MDIVDAQRFPAKFINKNYKLNIPRDTENQAKLRFKKI